jgi:hypothetical protein
VALSTVNGATTLRFRCWYENEVTCAHDVRELLISNDGFATTLYEHCFDGECPYQSWHKHDLLLDPAWGSVQLRFAFDTVAYMWNGGRGWFIDDLLVRECPVPAAFCSAAANSAGAGGRAWVTRGRTSSA